MVDWVRPIIWVDVSIGNHAKINDEYFIFVFIFIQISKCIDFVHHSVHRQCVYALHFAVSNTGLMCEDVSFLSSFMDSLCCVKNMIMYVLSWHTVYAFNGVLSWCLFSESLCNSGNKHKNNPFISTLTVHHSSPYIILYILQPHAISLLCWVRVTWETGISTFLPQKERWMEE